MTDVLTPEQRRFNMSRIRGRDTKPEMLVRRGLHARRLRFRLHRSDLPGRPDLTFPVHRAVIFVHGCFWHGHGCSLCKMPATRSAFWNEKVRKNIERDKSAVEALRSSFWRVLIVWECAIRGRDRLPLVDVLDHCEEFVRGHVARSAEISGVRGLFYKEPF